MIILYGATGYAGRLVARTLHEEDIEVVLAGRRPGAVRAVAEPLGFTTRSGSLNDLDLSGAAALLNCAGPFSRTAVPLISRCLEAGVHYLDLAGEVAEHQLARARDDAAREAGVMLLPGAGYGIVPSDCLAAHVAGRVERPTSVQIALKTVGGVSRGTAEVVLGGLRTPGIRRHGGTPEIRRAGQDGLKVDFDDGDGPTTVVTNPWRADLLVSVPDVPDLETYMSFPVLVRALMRIPHGGLLRTVARRLPEGPSDAALAKGRSAVWARATGEGGQSATAVVTGPDAYLFTARAAAACLRRVAAGEAPPGFQTPAGAWGADLVLDVRESARRDVRALD